MAENNNQPRPQNQGGQGQKNGNYQNRNRSYQNRNRSNKSGRPQQGAQGASSGEEPPKAVSQQNNPSRQQSRSGHKGYGRSKSYNNRFDNKKLPAIETVEDIAADISRIEKEIQLEIKEISAMTLG